VQRQLAGEPGDERLGDRWLGGPMRVPRQAFEVAE
jgi:hypothetical protein